MSVVETDYLVVGAGATGLAFADTLLDETDAHITVVDRHGAPGGHWNDAYPFVTLHQPSAFYGVNSLELGTRRKDTAGPNQGLYELASGAEITAYYDRVVRTRLLPSGRVGYHPMSEYDGAHGFRNLLSGAVTEVRVRRKVVDATYASPSVPSTHRPRLTVADDVHLVPPNALPGLAHRPPARFVVLGGGKTAMDTCVWLLRSGLDPEAITWVVPRDSWLINRVTTQPGTEFFAESIGGQADQLEAMAAATSTEDLFLRLERAGILTRVDQDRRPGMFHLATVAPGEVEVLRRIHDVVRLGRVRELHPDHMVLDEGSVPVAPGTVFVDCTASAVEPRPPQPVFQGDRIVLQLVRLPQPAFSAALTAWVEAHHEDDGTKNRLCGTVPFPHTLDDYPATMLATMWNQFHWGQDTELRRWIRASRLDGFGELMARADRADPQQLAILTRLKQHAPAAVANLTRLVEARTGAS
ncbi:Pyridine nucleotide-disulphide oxidoreductase [Klenkia soli]|uniref:Pyridine nucleotide-disulphide oxidoreductase n=1 Tax=Klenkia soli TaxID=1052260 RepID=A0A1H0L2Z1_9ACTN|nr:NAD(P)-binding protein [Klenkia soli]SDO62445.1 Pyridine nucleotide-disulphide oxidoreductase [Klenkia soli]